MIVFRALNREDIRQIVELELDKVAERLEEHKITLHATPRPRWTSWPDEGYDPDMGARPLRRVIQHKVEDRSRMRCWRGEFEDGDTILVDRGEEGEIILRRGERPAPEAPEKIEIQY